MIQQAIYVFLLALALAYMEVQTEGKDGWARNLPTWRISIFGIQRLGKEITGYHVALFILGLLFFHLPYIFGAPFTLDSEFQILSLFLLFQITEDFIWFVINPYFTIHKFNAPNIPWHKRWLLFLPVEYWGAIILSLALMSTSIYTLLTWLSDIFTICFVLILLTLIVEVYSHFKKSSPLDRQ